MPFLLIKGGPEKGRLYEVGSAPVTLGRDKNQTIQILDQGVSRGHAEIFKLGELYIIRDIQSTNGTFVNHERIEEEVLKDGDEILIGNTLIRFEETRSSETVETAAASESDDIEAMSITSVELSVEPQPATLRARESEAVRTIDSRTLQLTYEVGRLLTQEGDVEANVTHSLEVLMKGIEASQGYLLAVDLAQNRITSRCRVSRDSDSGSSKLSRAIVKHVVKTRRPTLCADATVDERFTYSESIVFRKIRSVIGVPLFAASEISGVLYFHKAEGPAFTVEDLELVSQVGLQISLAIETASFERRLKKGLDDAVRALVQAMEVFDAKGQGHARRVADYGQAIAMQMGLSRDEIYKIRLSGLLHDVGKLSCQNFEESGMIRTGTKAQGSDERHVFAGEKIVLSIEGGRDLLPGVKYHHERADGSGFPYKVKNAETPSMARIIIVANEFENRLHAQGVDPKQKSAMKDLLKGMADEAGTLFDSDVAKSLLIAHRKDVLYRVPDIFGRE
jgi:GAF domain-containing protein